METIEITITKKHLGSEFGNIYGCPLAKAMKETLGKDVIALISTIKDSHYKTIGNIHPGFEEDDYNDLNSGKIEQFITYYTPI